MEMKKIVWITANNFADHDFEQVAEISKRYKVIWIIVMPIHETRFTEEEFAKYNEKNSLVNIEFFYLKYRLRDPRSILNYYLLGKEAAKHNADIYYIDIQVTVPWYKLLFIKLPRKRTIITAHQGELNEAMKQKALVQFSRDIVYKNAPYVKMFSKVQAELFSKRYPKCHLTITYLPLIDYGKPTVSHATGLDNEIKFLAFGSIRWNKHVDLLIDAACNLYDKGVRGFKVLIHGACFDDWDKNYKPKIKYPELFDLAIDFISNDDVANLLSQVHYLVLPYRTLSQSGPLKIAFNYNTPVITSDLPSFRDEIEENTNGFMFKTEDVHDLERVMEERIINFHQEYDLLREKMNAYTQANYSSENITKKYIDMFEEVLKK